MNRRNFSKAVAAGLGLTALPLVAAPKRRLKIGHTCITWGTFPNAAGNPTLEAAVKDIASLGYWGFETFPENLADWDAKGTLNLLIEQNKLPLTSGYIRMNLLDPAARKEGVADAVRLAKIIKKYGGTFAVLAPGGIKREGYNFQEHKANIIAAMNDYAMAVTDVGLGTGLHQHTGTAIETRDEVYTVMDAVNTKYMKFAPDVGQLQKGGADAAKVVKDFLPLVRHMHLKDYSGGEEFLGYCPLGQGKVDLAAILNSVEGGKQPVNIMVELDPSPKQPITALETAKIAKAYLEKQGYKFRS
jgi:inosose dehydratase